MKPQRRPFQPIGKNDSKTRSSVMSIAWFLIIGWSIFLVFCWKYELINLSSNPSAGDSDSNSQPSSFRAETVEAQLNAGQDSTKKEDYRPSSNSWGKDSVHVIFSTDCTAYQDWQTLLVFHSAHVVKQKGPITRIASGCDAMKMKELTQLYRELWPQYHVHFTPDFKHDERTNSKYDFYNKPYGLKHWLENANPPLEKDAVIALIDPDFIFLRPLTSNIAEMKNNIVSGPWKNHEIFEKVEKGKPAGQTYGLGAPWVNDNHKKFNRGKICGENSPCLEVPDEGIGSKYYSLGPPYIAQKEDMERIARSWTTFVPRVFEGYPFLLAEMYAYSMAAAHEKLPHLRMDQWMVSNTEAGGEGWPWVDSLDEVCRQPDEEGIYYPDFPLPTFIHYCQTYTVGDLSFSKRGVRKDLFSCHYPLLIDPSNDLATAAYKTINFKEGKKEDVKRAKQAKRNAFMLCTIHRSLNAALTDFKKRMCGNQNVTSYDKVMNVRTFKGF